MRLQAQQQEARPHRQGIADGASAKAERDLSFTEIRAPVNGVFGNRAVQTGDFVQTGQRLASLVPLDNVYIEANFKETQLASLKPGQKVAISVDAIPEHAIEGMVASVSPASGAVFSLLPPDNATGNFTKIVQRVPVRIEVPANIASKHLLRPGLSVVVSVNTKRAAVVDAIPGFNLVTANAHQVIAARGVPWPRTTFNPSLVEEAAERIDPRRLFAFLAMCFGMFMAFLDIQIVSASLAEIQAGLAASQDEITWVQTSYLMAEVVAIPFSGFLSRVLGTRIMFASSAAGFTFASLMCGLSSSMSEMIVWRAIQGFLGGGMVPTVFASAYIIFPRSRMPMIVPMIGLVATLAPTIGPTVGGYLTEALSWHWLFFINIVPGIIVTFAALALIDFDRPNFALFDKFDWWGLIFMAGFLGTLEYVLEEGPRNDWFDDRTVFLCAVVSVLSAVAFFARVLSAREPIVDLKAFTRPQLRARQHVLVRARHRALRPDLSVSGLSRADPRLQRADGRRDHVHLRRRDVRERADRRPTDESARSAYHADERILHLRDRLVADDIADQGLGFLGAVRAADFPWCRHDARNRADYERCSRHTTA